METLEQKLEALKGLADQMCEIIDGIDGKVKVSFLPKEQWFTFAHSGQVENGRVGSRMAILVEVSASAGAE